MSITLKKIPQISEYLSHDEQFAIEVVGHVLPFKVNNYVIEKLIDWKKVPDDPMFTLTFPRKDMLKTEHFNLMAEAIQSGAGKAELKILANTIRHQLNPHPAGQVDKNIPELDGAQLTGIQHKYSQTVLFFPSHSQTCHAYCTFCFRWPQFVAMDDLKFASKETDQLVEYVRRHPEVTDILFTGGDPMIMKVDRLRAYIQPILDAKLPNLKTIRIRDKSPGILALSLPDR